MSLRQTAASISIFLLLASSLLVMPAAGTHGGSPKVQILSADYDTPPVCTPTPSGISGPCIQGYGNFFVVEVQDLDLTASVSTVTVTVRSTVDLSGETITLNRHTPATGGNANTFFGTVGFEASAVAGNGKVRVVDGDNVVVTYTAPNTGVPSTATVRFFESVTGAISLDASTYFGAGPTTSDSTARVTIVDADLNANGNVQESWPGLVTVRTSARLNDIITITITETGINTGIFTGEFKFTNGTSSGSNIAVAGGFGPEGPIVTTLTVQYNDTVDVQGNAANVTQLVTWQEARTAVVDFVSADRRTVMTGQAYNGTQFAYVRVFDLEKDVSSANDKVTVSITSATGQPSPALQFELTESGPHTGEFFGQVELVTTAQSSKLRVSDPSPTFSGLGDVLTVTYNDAFNTTGADPAAQTATAGWHRRTDGSVRFTRSDFLSDITASENYFGNGTGLLGAPYIRVDDADMNTDSGNLDTVTVTLASTLDPRNKVMVVLDETGVNTGVFTGSGVFATQTTNAAEHIWVADRSSVVATYSDINGVGTTVARTAATTWRPAETATILASAETVFGLRPATDGIFVTVVDADANTAAGSAQTVNVAVSAPGASSISVALTEVHANSGVFRGRIGFTSTFSDDTNDAIRVANNTVVTVLYNDTATETGSQADVTDTFGWQAPRATDNADFSSDRFHGTDTATVYLTNSSIDTATTVRCLSSDATGSNPNLNLTFTRIALNTYKATFGFTSGDSASGNIKSAFSTTPTTISLLGGNGTVTTTPCLDTALPVVNTTQHVSWQPASEASFFDQAFASRLADTHRDFGLNRSAFLNVSDSDANRNSNLVETLEVTVGDETLALIEVDCGTKAAATNSSCFQRRMPYEAAASSNSGAIGVATGTTVKLTYDDTGRNGTKLEDTIIWHRNGTVAFQQSLGGATVTSYIGNRTVFLEINDPFQSKAPAPVGDVSVADVFTVRVESRDGGESLSVVMTETGPNTDVFRGSFPLSMTNATGFLKVGLDAADRDDLINVTFQDNTTAGDGQHVEHVLATIAWTRAETGILCLTKPPQLGNEFAGGNVAQGCDVARPLVPGAADETRYHGLATHQRQSYVLINDPGMDTSADADSIPDVRITSTADGTGISVVARETAARSGIFMASFGFTTGTSSDASDTLRVAEGNTVSATYVDPARSDGTSSQVLVTNTVLWNETFTGTLSLDKQKYAGTDSPIVTLTDKDLDRTSSPDTFDVTYVSIPLSGGAANLTGTIRLTETTATSGVFRATGTQFQNLTQGDCTTQQAKVCVHSNGSYVVFTYVEARNGDGREPLFASVNVTWRPANSGYVLLDLDLYATYGATGTVTVVDANLNSDQIAVNTGFVRLLSNSDPSGEIIPVTETGLNTGVFTGTIGFESARTVGNGKVFASDQDLITAIYYDELDGRPTPADSVDRDTARFQSAAAVAPTAILTASPLSGAPPLAVTFNLSASDDGQITSWALDINNDGTSEFTGTDNLKASTLQRTHSYSNAGTHVAKLTVTDNSGNTGSTTVTVTVSSTVTPGTPTATLTANATSGALPLAVNFTIGGTDEGIIASWTLDANGDGIADFSGTDNLKNGSVNRAFNYTTVGVFTARLNVTDNSGNTGSATLVITATNGTPPVAILTALATSGNAPLSVNFTLGATEDQTIVSWALDVNNDGTAEFNGTDNLKSATVQRTHVYTTAGTHVAKLTVTDNQGNPNSTTVTITVSTVSPPTGVTAAQIQAANQGVVVTVTRDGDDNIVSWTLPSNLPATPRGVQIFRSTSPFTLLKTLLSSDTDYQDRSFRDEDAPATAKYLVTVFYGLTPAEGFFPGTGDPEGVIPGFAALGSGTSAVDEDDDDGGLSTLAWILIVLGIIVVLALIVLLVIMLTRKKDEEEETVDDTQAGWAPTEPAVEAAPAAAPAPTAEVHTLRCPACSTEFQATGPKPLTTNCPNCGRRGILR